MPTLKKKPAVAPTDRRRAVKNFNAALWSVPMAVEWSGLCHERILELIHAGEIEAVAVGPETSYVRDGSTRRRSCAKYLVVAAPLKKFVKTLAVRGKLLRSA